MSFKKILLIVFIVLGLVTLGGMLIVYSFMDIKLSSIDGKGEVVETIESPDGKKQADTYLIYGNTADKNQVRVSITGVIEEEKVNDKTVYWLYPSGEKLPEVKWTSEKTLEIAKQKIKITDESTYYNYRKDKDLNQ